MSVVGNKKVLIKIGSKIQKARNNKKYTQEYVAEKIDKSVDTLRNIENGRSVGSVETLINICNVLDITMDDIFYDLLERKNIILDNKIYEQFQELEIKDKELIYMLINHLKK